MRRLLPLLTLVAATGCEPAEPIDATDAGQPLDARPDTAAPPLDAQPACPDDDQDGVVRADCALPGQLADCDDTDPRVRPGASDPCGDDIDQDCDGADTRCPEGCTPSPTVAPCDAIDDDCDGVVEECGPQALCDDEQCVGTVGAPCGSADAAPCARGTTCVDDRCTGIEPGGLCAGDLDCPADAICRLQDTCDLVDERCYALQGGRCAFPCDCADPWVCSEDLARCVTCVIDAQCDGAARCTAAGLCAVGVTLGGDRDALDRLLRELLTCQARNAGATVARGCAILDTEALVAEGSAIGALAPPPAGSPRVCDPADLAARGFDVDDISAIAELFGCADAPPTLDWITPIPAERAAAACITHLPPWARPATRAEGLAITSCGTVPYTRAVP